MNTTKLKKLHIFVTIIYILVSLIEIIVLVKEMRDRKKKNYSTKQIF